MRKEYDYIIVGAGLCGLALAKDLVQRKKRVLILEKGRFLNRIGTIPRALLFYEGHGLAYSRQRVNIYRINAVGGTSIVACGNAVTPSDEEIRKTGIDFTAELPAVKKESFVHDEGLVIGRASRRIMDEAISSIILCSRCRNSASPANAPLAAIASWVAPTVQNGRRDTTSRRWTKIIMT